MRNGQDVVIFAPRRYGKSSLVWRAEQALLVARGCSSRQIDLMTTPTKERLAEKLAASIYENIASPLERVRERALAPFPRPADRSRPSPSTPRTARFSFSFGLARGARRPRRDPRAAAGACPPSSAAERERRVALVLDEFQEVDRASIPRLPQLLRSVFQQQPEVAHVYLGSRRHVMERIFNDENEPFWRSAKPVELGADRRRRRSPPSSRERFARHGQADRARRPRARS